MIYFPEKFRHLAPAAPGNVCDRLVSLMDLGPTILSLLELPIPPPCKASRSSARTPPSRAQYVFGARDRVDEVLELSRSVRDHRYLYIRNYMPDLSWHQPESYSDQLAFRREMAHLAAANKLNAAQLTLAGPTKPVEALYDTEKDPYQVDNVATSPEHQEVLARMRKALGDWQRQYRDLGMIHEWQAAKMCADGKPLCEVASTDKDYPLERVLDTAGRVGISGQAAELVQRLSDADPTVRYWAAVGLRAAGRRGSLWPGGVAQGYGRPFHASAN